MPNLVLKRKLNEQIVVDDKITITVVEIKGKHCRLAISAPAEIGIHRKEVLSAVRPAKAA